MPRCRVCVFCCSPGGTTRNIHSIINSLVRITCDLALIAKTVLVAKRVFDLRIDLLDGLALRDLVVGSAGFPRHAPQSLFAVLARQGENHSYHWAGKWNGIGKANGIDDGVRSLRGFDRGEKLRLAGPGLAAPATIAVQGLPEHFVAAWEANHALYPRGVDLILCAGEELAAFPRSLRITEG